MRRMGLAAPADPVFLTGLAPVLAVAAAIRIRGILMQRFVEPFRGDAGFLLIANGCANWPVGMTTAPRTIDKTVADQRNDDDRA